MALKRHRRRKSPPKTVSYAAERLAEQFSIPTDHATAVVKAQRSFTAAVKAAFGDAIGIGYKIPRAADYADGLHLIAHIEDHILGAVLGHGNGGRDGERALGLFQQKLERDGYWFDMADGGTMHIRTQGSESMAIRRMDMRRSRGVDGYCTC